MRKGFVYSALRDRVARGILHRQRRVVDFGRAIRIRNLSSWERALDWLYYNELKSGGIRVHAGHSQAYQEVTGYIIPTLVAYEQLDLARRCAEWLIRVQQPNGSFVFPEGGEPYVFDSGQALRGLLAVHDICPESRHAARRAADFILQSMVDGGRKGFPNRYGGKIVEGIHLYALPPMIEAADRFGVPLYRTAAERCLDFYCSRADLLSPETLTHFLAYEIEALIDLGRPEFTTSILSHLRGEQTQDGAIRALPGKEWVCAAGLLQLAVCWYKTGCLEPAERAFKWMEERLQPSGGFLGSYGPGAAYFPTQELSWNVKYFLDACRLRGESE